MNQSTLLLAVALHIFACSQSDSGPQPPIDNQPPGKSGKMAFAVESHQIGDYTIDIYVPQAAAPAAGYPAIYFNDGENFTTTINRLTLRNFEDSSGTEPYLIVGIHSGGTKRTSRYTPYEDEWIKANWGSYAPGAGAYSADLSGTIIPFVESIHPVDASRRALIGISLGGLHAAWMGLNYPEVFSFVGAISPSFWVADYAIFREPDGPSETVFYFDMGTKEWNNYVPFIESLKKTGKVYGTDIFYYEVPNGRHVEADWTQRIYIPASLFLNGAPQEISSIEVEVECIPSQSTPGLIFQRLNPIVTFTNGVMYSLSASASYQRTSGSGEVLPDGRFDAKGSVLEVEISFGDWSERLELKDCR